jgi:hypothetical protein
MYCTDILMCNVFMEKHSTSIMSVSTAVCPCILLLFATCVLHTGPAFTGISRGTWRVQRHFKLESCSLSVNGASVHSMNANGDCGSIFSLYYLGTNSSWSTSESGHFTPGNEFRFPLNRSQCETHRSCGRFGVKDFCLSRFEPDKLKKKLISFM